MKVWPSLAAVLAPFVIGLVACTSQSNQGSPSSGTNGNTPNGIATAPAIPETYASGNDLKPDATPPKEANLLLGGSLIEVELREARDGDKVTFNWIAPPIGDGSEIVEIEGETYQNANSTFSFVAGPAESYEPAIPLVKFPFTIGDTWEWTGKQTLGRTQRPARATVSSAVEELNTPVGLFATVRITVDLIVESGTPGGTETQFKFWFKPGEGLIKRELGKSSTREPRAPASPVENSGD